jgi:WD40 repeat protein
MKTRMVIFFCFLTVSITAGARDFDPYYFDKISIIKYSCDGRYIATAELAGLIKIYDSATLDTVGEFEGPVAAQAMEFSPDNLYLAVSENSWGSTNDIRIYEINTGNIIFRLPAGGHQDDIISISYRFDGQRLVAATEYGFITIWDTINGIKIMTLNSLDRSASKVSYSPNGNKILLSSRHHLRIWDANKGKVLKTLDIEGWEAHASYSQDGTKIVVSYWRLPPNAGRIRIYGTGNYDVLYFHDLGNEIRYRSNVSFVLNSNYIIIYYDSSSNKTVTIMNYTDGNIINTYTFDLYTPVAVSPDGRSFCYSENLKDIVTVDNLTSPAPSR